MFATAFEYETLKTDTEGLDRNPLSFAGRNFVGYLYTGLKRAAGDRLRQRDGVVVIA